MLTERNEDEITNKVRNFISSKEDEGVFIYPLAKSELEQDKYNVSFCAAGFVVDPRGEKIDFVTFTADGTRQGATHFLREIFEWDYGEGGNGVDDIEGWLVAADASYSNTTPLFAISFGYYENIKKKAVFVHVKDGVTLNSAISTLKRYAEITLFGGEFKFKAE